jgi:hypothetical protein
VSFVIKIIRAFRVIRITGVIRVTAGITAFKCSATYQLGLSGFLYCK